MKTWARKTLSIGVLAAGALLLAPAAAQAGQGDQTAVGNGGILSGNNSVISVAVPVNLTGNGIGVAGEGQGVGSSANHLEERGKRDRDRRGNQQVSLGNRGLASGNNTYVPVQVPINIVGNGIGVLGYGEGRGAAANYLHGRTESAQTEGGHDRDGDRGGRGGRGGQGDQLSAGNGGVLSGNNTQIPVTAPINVCGNGIGLLGFGDGSGACANYVEGRRSSQQTSVGNRGIGSGNNTQIPVFAPINITGNAVGDGEGRGAGKNVLEDGRRGGGNDRDQLSAGNHGLLSGNNTKIPVTAPINICGNALAILGYGEGAGSCANDVDGDGRGRDHDGRGHGHGNNNGGNNGGNGGHNGHDDDDNDGDHGNYGGNGHNNNDDDDDVMGNGGSQGGGKYGDKPRESAQPESSPLAGLTQNLTNAGGVNVGSLLGQ